MRDFGSKNGTFVNGERIASERELKPGDRLKVGPLEFEVSFEPLVSADPKQAPATSSSEHVDRATGKETVQETDLDDWLINEIGMDARQASPSDSTTDDLIRPGQATIDDSLAPPTYKDKEKPDSSASGSGSDEAAAEMLRKLRRFR